MARNGHELEVLKRCVQQKFVELRAALHMREKLLMRQIDVIATSQQQIGRGTQLKANDNATSNDEREIKFLAEQEDELLAAIRSFGRFQLDNMNLTLQDVYLKNEDYIAPSNDHETMYKCLQQHSGSNVDDRNEDESKESIVVDFSRNKSLIEHNTKHVNDSIINITLQEAKELIRKAKIRRETPIPPLNLEELDDELESSIAEAVHSLGHDSPINTKSSQTCLDSRGKLKKNCYKPKITINNCNGTINLRNISSLTINCTTEDSVSAEIPYQQKSEDNNIDEEDTSTQCSKYSHNTPKAQATSIVESSSTDTTTATTTASSSNYSSNSSSRSQSQKQKNNKKQQSSKTAPEVTNYPSTSITTGVTQPTSTYPYEIDDNDYDEPNDVTCDFYNRLLNEIKNSLQEKTKRTIDNTHYLINGCGVAEAPPSSTTDTTTRYDQNANTSNCTSTLTAQGQQQQQQQGRRLVLKNFENLKIILEANSDEETFHPVQIEQWLAEIISETDLEPMQNTDILEHSKIDNEST